MTAYEKYFGSVEKVVETMTSPGNMQIFCPSDFGMKDDENCYDCLCTDCWKRALERKVEK
jgi:hypothetical protein